MEIVVLEWSFFFFFLSRELMAILSFHVCLSCALRVLPSIGTFFLNAH